MGTEPAKCSKCMVPAETWRKDGSMIVICHGCRFIEGRGPQARDAVDGFVTFDAFTKVVHADLN